MTDNLHARIRIEFVTATIEMARASQCSKRHAAMIVRGNRVIGAGINYTKTHPAGKRSGSRYWTYHAEVAALSRLKKDPSKPLELPARGAVLYSLRNGIEKQSRPCADCTAKAQEKGIRLMVFVNALGRLDSERL